MGGPDHHVRCRGITKPGVQPWHGGGPGAGSLHLLPHRTGAARRVDPLATPTQVDRYVGGEVPVSRDEVASFTFRDSMMVQIVVMPRHLVSKVKDLSVRDVRDANA